MVLLLHDLLHSLLFFECDEAEASPFVGFVLHGELDRLHLLTKTRSSFLRRTGRLGSANSRMSTAGLQATTGAFSHKHTCRSPSMILPTCLFSQSLLKQQIKG